LSRDCTAYDGKFIKNIIKFIFWPVYVWNVRRRFVCSEKLDTPIYPFSDDILENDKNCVVIYPETCEGNPLRAKNVVRWLLHAPGFHNKKVHFGIGELYFDYLDYSKNFSIPGSYISSTKLYITRYPTEFYNMNGAVANTERTGSAYWMRRGKERAIVHSLENSINIDGLSHFEISQIFKSVKYFYCYDLYTAYHIFAVLCGAKTIIMPDEKIAINAWLPRVEDRYGLAYGFSNLNFAEETRPLLMEKIESQEQKNFEVVGKFIQEADLFFRKNNVV